MKKAEHPTPNIQHPTSNAKVAKRRFDLEARMLAHAARIVELYDSLPTGSGAKHVGNQLVRSGTSPYLHHGEVEAADSLDDFIHKLKVCLKELRETWRALRLLYRLRALENAREVESLIDETQQLIRIFYASVRTARSRPIASSRIREDDVDADDWVLGVGCWMLDVDFASEPNLSQEDAP